MGINKEFSNSAQAQHASVDKNLVLAEEGYSAQRRDHSAQAQAQQSDLELDWETDPRNPYNWPAGKKAVQIYMLSMAALTAYELNPALMLNSKDIDNQIANRRSYMHRSIGTSLPSSAVFQLREEFGVNTTQSILPVSMYVFALGLGPVVGGPLSETVGRYPVYLLSAPLGALFTLGAGFTHSFVALCILRFLAGFCFSPSLAIATGTINETYKPAQRALPSALFILMPFLGPGLGYVSLLPQSFPSPSHRIPLMKSEDQLLVPSS
jgi:hypothetical protein